MSANAGSWRAAHGKLWYDDPWYRTAWIVWPQAIGLLLFVTLWLYQPGGPSLLPWAKPVAETPRTPPLAVKEPAKEQSAPTKPEQTADIMAPCKSENYPEAIQACTALLTSGNLKGNSVSEAYWHRGWAYYSTKQYQQAMSDYDRAIAISPRSFEYYNDRAVLWIDLDNNDRALQDLDQAILIKPNYFLAFANRGVALRNLKRPNEALFALNIAIDGDPKQWLAFENRAAIYEGRSDWKAMYDDANKLIELAPNYKMGYAFRGHAYLESSQQLPAIADFTKAISLDPNYVYGYRMRGRAYYFLNQFDNAMADFQAALRIDPNDSYTIGYINDLKNRQRGR